MLHDMPKAPGTCVVSRMHQGCMVEYHVPEVPMDCAETACIYEHFAIVGAWRSRSM